jgi:hypothetical protein
VALSEAKLCNVALARVGHRQFLDSLEEATAEARVCKELYAPTRDALLASLPWGFATRRAVLAAVAGAERTGWEYVYALPDDCVTARYLWAGRTPTPERRIPFVLEHDAATGRAVLLADLEAAELVYTARIETPTMFPPLFDDALAWRLASELALALAVKPQVAMAMDQRARMAMLAAGAAEMNQSQEDQLPEGESVRAR